MVLKSTQNNQKRLRLAFLTGSIIGLLVLLGMFLSDSANNSFQQTDADSSNSKSSSSTVDSSSLSEQESKEIIEQWLEAKSRIFAPPYDRELLEELATGERYRNNIGSLEWLQENDAYYEFGVQKVEEIERFTTNNDEATVKFRYTEDRTLYMNGEIVPEQSDFKTRTVIYNLQFKQEQWKIESAKIVN